MPGFPMMVICTFDSVRGKMKFIQLLFCVIFLISCASQETNPNEAKVEKEPTNSDEVSIAPVEVKREPGSLWSTRSLWNEIYSSHSFRKPGDIILVEPTRLFREILIRKMGKTKNDLEPTDPKNKRANAFIPEEHQILAATIKEVRPQGIYKIELKQIMTVAKKQQELTIEGSIREQDISDDDRISSDLIFDRKIDATLTKKEKQWIKKSENMLTRNARALEKLEKAKKLRDAKHQKSLLELEDKKNAVMLELEEKKIERDKELEKKRSEANFVLEKEKIEREKRINEKKSEANFEKEEKNIEWDKEKRLKDIKNEKKDYQKNAKKS